MGAWAAFQRVGVEASCVLDTPRHLSLSPTQVCSKREKRLADPTLEKYVLTVVLDTINAFFSSPFSENSTSLQVCFCPRQLLCRKGEKSACTFIFAHCE